MSQSIHIAADGFTRCIARILSALLVVFCIFLACLPVLAGLVLIHHVMYLP
jgi:hypothetical protein